MTVPDPLHAEIDAIYRAESRRVFATLVRLLGDFDPARGQRVMQAVLRMTKIDLDAVLRAAG